MAKQDDNLRRDAAIRQVRRLLLRMDSFNEALGALQDSLDSRVIAFSKDIESLSVLQQRTSRTIQSLSKRVSALEHKLGLR